MESLRLSHTSSGLAIKHPRKQVDFKRVIAEGNVVVVDCLQHCREILMWPRSTHFDWTKREDCRALAGIAILIVHRAQAPPSDPLAWLVSLEIAAQSAIAASTRVRP